MILGARSFDLHPYRGINIFLCKSWSPPLDFYGRQALQAFDETLLRLKSDTEATRLYVVDSKEPREITDMNTAAAAALRSLPEKMRASCQIFTTIQSRDLQGLWSNLPNWTLLRAEAQNGDLHDLRLPEGTPQWQRVPTEADDRWIHLSFFGSAGRLSLRPEAGPFFARLSALIHSAENPHLCPSLSFRLKSGEEARPQW
jgi:hypothetical protein